MYELLLVADPGDPPGVKVADRYNIPGRYVGKHYPTQGSSLIGPPAMLARQLDRVRVDAVDLGRSRELREVCRCSWLRVD